MKRVAAGFLILMAVFTFLSRALDSVTVTRVNIGYGRQGTVSHRITGEGVFEAGALSCLPLPEGLLVAEVNVKPGERVNAGETVLTMETRRLMEVREELENDRRQAELALEQERLSAKTYPGVTQEMLARQQLEASQRALALGKQDMEEAEGDCAANLDALRQEYDRLAGRSEEEIREEARRAAKSAGRAYDSAKLERERAIKQAERDVKDKQKKLDRLTEREDADEEALEEAELELERAGEDLDEVREEQDILVEEARAALRAAEENYEDRDYDSAQAKEDLKRACEDGIKAEEDKLKAARRQVQQLEEAAFMAARQLENAKISDAGTRSREETQKEISRLRQESLELELTRAERRLQKVDGLIALEGAVKAPEDAFVAGIDAAAGETTASGDQIRLARGALVFTAQVDKEDAALIRQGTKMAVKRPGVARDTEVRVESVNRLTVGELAQVAAEAAEGVGSPGETGSFTVFLESEVYPTVIPIEALREDNKGFYCLAAEPQKTILGEELAAMRIDVELLEKGSAAAAVSGAIGVKTRLITSSNKGVAAGDRVRVTAE